MKKTGLNLLLIYTKISVSVNDAPTHRHKTASLKNIKEAHNHSNTYEHDH